MLFLFLFEMKVQTGMTAWLVCGSCVAPSHENYIPRSVLLLFWFLRSFTFNFIPSILSHASWRFGEQTSSDSFNLCACLVLWMWTPYSCILFLLNEQQISNFFNLHSGQSKGNSATSVIWFPHRIRIDCDAIGDQTKFEKSINWLRIHTDNL